MRRVDLQSIIATNESTLDFGLGLAGRGAGEANNAPSIGATLWHLSNTGANGMRLGIDANVSGVWSDYTGRGVKVAIYDDGVDASHSALVDSYRSSRELTAGGAMSDPQAATAAKKHGTAVAGIIAANPGANATGVAYDSEITGVQIYGGSNEMIFKLMGGQKGFDVVNHSWRWVDDFADNKLSWSWSSFFQGIKDAADTGRGGLGTVMVVAAGNERSEGGNANTSNFTNDRHMITVGAVSDQGSVASYSNPGASLLVSAPSSGGINRVPTTDAQGSAGYTSGANATLGGTSAAAPIISGVVALILEANPDLGWRDVQSILAASAKPVGASGWGENGAETWNGGGFRFSNDYGFGLVDAQAAVRLAETWTLVSNSANEAVVSADAAGGSVRNLETLTLTFELAPGIDIEHAELNLGLYHGAASDLRIELVSPSGTRSTLIDGDGGAKAIGGWTFASNAFRGEDSAGQWTVYITDTKGGAQGTVGNATLSLFGAAESADDVYLYTDAFATIGGEARNVLADLDGRDTINAAAVTADAFVDLNPGHGNWIAGRGFTLSPDTLIEHAFTGDGNDRLVGNVADNILYSGRGNDHLIGGQGDDVLIGGPSDDLVDGGEGYDMALFAGAYADYDVFFENSLLIVSGGADDRDTFFNVEQLVFDDRNIDVVGLSLIG